ncbi:MAG: LytTR family DNA-binding domain-containing protein [Pacificimonas sp.]|jgi:two-component system response regulator AlgR|nr:LytTR family DNA-binding domain-containing protein [Pacificimonas sp.]
MATAPTAAPEPALLRTLIVDDEPMAVERLQLLLSDNDRIQCVGTANDGESALRLIDAIQPDLLLLDISMPGLSGIEVARTIAASKTRPSVVFVTAFDQHAVQAFDLEASDYLLKPVERERLSRAVDRIWDRRSETGTPANANADAAHLEEFWVGHRGDMIRMAADEVERIEAERDYMRLHVGDRSYLLHATMASLEEKLDPAAFVRIHRSHIFRRDCIRKLVHDGIGAWFVEDTNGARVRIGRTYLKAVKAIAAR